MATINELLRMFISNIESGLRDGSKISIALGLAQVEQARSLLDKGHVIEDELNDINLSDEGCDLQLTKYLSEI